MSDRIYFTIIDTNCVDPSFLTRTTSEAHGLLEGWISFRFGMSWSSSWTSSLLHGGILLACCLIGWWSPVLIECCSLLVLPIWLSFIAKTSVKPSRRLNRWCFCCTFRVLPLFCISWSLAVTSKSGSLTTSVVLATTHVVGSVTADSQAMAVPLCNVTVTVHWSVKVPYWHTCYIIMLLGSYYHICCNEAVGKWRAKSSTSYNPPVVGVSPLPRLP